MINVLMGINLHSIHNLAFKMFWLLFNYVDSDEHDDANPFQLPNPISCL